MALLLGKWDTDEIYANYIAPALESNVALIPGITMASGISEINGSAAVYYVQAEGVVTEGDAGRDFSDNEGGVTRKNCTTNEVNSSL